MRYQLKSCSALLFIMLLGVILAGCQAHQFTYPDHQPEQVWRAMISAAESPEYDDWHVNTNEVTVLEQDKRIEIHRVIERELHRPNARTLQESQSWKMGIRLVSAEPPTAEFVARNWTVPVKAQWQAWEYFQTVQFLLQHPEEMGVLPLRTQPTTQPTTQPATQPATQPQHDEPDDDLDDLLTPGQPAGQKPQ